MFLKVQRRLTKSNIFALVNLRTLKLRSISYKPNRLTRHEHVEPPGEHDELEDEDVERRRDHQHERVEQLERPRPAVPADVAVELLPQLLLAEHVGGELLVTVVNGQFEDGVADPAPVAEVLGGAGRLREEQADLGMMMYLVV